jgi:phosphatidylglycerophosphatase A
MKRRFGHIFGTFFGVGFIPIVPATWTSLVVALLFFFVPIDGLGWQLAFVAFTVVLGVPACTALEEEFGEDPKQATMDEAAGMAITLLAVPLTPLNVMLGFVLFRVFDVLKPQPARAAEGLPGGWGIMTDDIIAGIYARLAMAAWLWLR